MSSLIHDHSCECSKSELDLFMVPPTQTSIEHGQWVEYQPLATLTDKGPIEFNIPGAGDDYIDLANTYFRVRAKVTTATGTALDAATDIVAPVNYWINSLWSQIDLSLNEKLITSSNNTYPYRAYIETLLSFGQEAKKSQLTTALWYKDEAGKFEVVDGAENTGFTRRSKAVISNGIVDMVGKIHLDMFFQPRYLLNGVDVKLRLSRSKDEFNLMCKEGKSYKVNINEVTMFVRKVLPNPAVRMGHIKGLEKARAKYPIRRVETKSFTIPEGNMSVTQENLFLGQLPKRVVLGFVTNKAFNGTFHMNPFNFRHQDINFLALYVDGQQVPAKPLQPDFSNGKFMRSYLTLYNGTGQYYKNEGNYINRDEYANGYTLFVFDLTPDLFEGAHFNLIKRGTLRLEVHFGQALTSTLNAVVYAEFDNLIEIDRDRHVLFDFAA